MWQGIGLGALTGAVWGMVFLVPQLLPGFTPLEQMAGRYVLYGMVSLLLVLPRARSYLRRLTGADYRALLWLSVLGNLVYYVSLAAGVQLIGIAPTSLVVGMLPVVVAVVGSLGHGEIPLRRLLCLCSPSCWVCCVPGRMCWRQRRCGGHVVAKAAGFAGRCSGLVQLECLRAGQRALSDAQSAVE